MKDFEAFLDEIEREADDRFAEVLIRVLDARAAEPSPVGECAKCNSLLGMYIQWKLTLHRVKRREERGWGTVSDRYLSEMMYRVRRARSDFHGAQCICGERKGIRYNNARRVIRDQDAGSARC